MGLRTIEAPGVEIKEIDKSGYTPVMTGTKCLVMGYSDKGTPYEPMQFTSKTAWQNFYGDPDNEAERYFYNACSEVINQNGVLNCARIPYDNDAKDYMVGFKFKVSTNTTSNPTAGQYLQDYPVKSWVDHNNNFEQSALKHVIHNNCLREINGDFEVMENDTEICAFYSKTIERFNATYNTLSGYRRCSISYYEVNKEKSAELSARFLTKKEAIQYLNDSREIHVGHYEICCDFSESATYDLSNGMQRYGESLIRDRGDWIAQPLYCDYNKEAVMSGDYQASCWNTNIAYAPHIKTNTGNLIQKCVKIPEISALKDTVLSSVDILKSTISSMHETYQIYLLSGCSEELQESYNNLSVIEDIKMCFDFFEGKETQRGEFLQDGYAIYREEKLKETKGYIDAIDVTKKDEKLPLQFEYAQFKDVNVWVDGADNEYMFEVTVSQLWEDPKLALSATEISDMYDTELWEPYKEKNLSGILRVDSKPESEQISCFDHMLTIYKQNGGITFQNIIDKFDVTQTRIHDDVPYYRIADLDGNLDNYLTITQAQLPIKETLDNVDAFRSGEEKVAANTFWVFDKTCATLNSVPEDNRKGKERQMIGIFPVITTAANALYAQSLIDVDDEEVIDYETVDGVITKDYSGDDSNPKTNSLLSTDVTLPFSQKWKKEGDTSAIDTVSRQANDYFLPIETGSKMDTSSGKEVTYVDQENMKKIGVVVFKAYLDASEGNKVSFNPVESFVGSLNKDDKNPNTGVTTFIDNIVNTQSEYIYFFSNCFASPTSKTKYRDVVDFYVHKVGITGMLGWFSNETEEIIALTGLYQGIDKCFSKLEDINERDIDIVCDAGLANIAQYQKSVYGGKGAHAYDLEVTDDNGNPLIKNWKVKAASDVNAWKTVQFKYDNFCKNVRRDCMFIADGPRPLTIQGQVKIVRPSKPTNSIDANILPYVKYITGLNTNYGAGYCDWFQITDEFTGDEFWCPPSIKAMGVYINTDLNFNYWDAPAGLNRGVIQALDCSFSPTIKQAGSIYTKNWNYAINYPYDGIVLEGQKTFQVKPSAFDRVNVRRLFLRLERQTYKVARYFVYEGNTAYTRQRLVDMLDPLFYQAKVGGGIYDYKIICDESVNDANTIDNNELRVKIGIKPVKTAEFILIDFVAFATGGDFSEL